jgi:alkane 1-monooxygenase
MASVLAAPVVIVGAGIPIALVWGADAAGRCFLAFISLVLVVDCVLAWLRKSSTQRSILSTRLAHPVAISIWGLVQPALLLWAIDRVSSAALSGAAILQLALVVGLANGVIGMSVAHELLHQPQRAFRMIASVLLGTVLYGHFSIAHLKLHHRLVATADDPATAVVGESLYRFFGRSIVDGYVRALEWDAAHLCKQGRFPFGIENRAVRCAVANIIVISVIGIGLGTTSLTFFLAQAGIAVYCLEALNYVQHYGLLRRQGGSSLEIPGFAHSWDSPGIVTNWLLLGLGDHAGHHCSEASRKKRNVESGPMRLPMPYLAMIVVAALPYLWRRIMNPRVYSLRQVPSRPERRVIREDNES